MIILFFFSSLICACYSCPSGSGWRPSSNIRGKCYNIVTTRKIWFDAEYACTNLAPSSHLTSVSSAFETYNINGIVMDTTGILVCDQLWIGANDFYQRGNFTWSDNKPFNYANWDVGQPDLSNQCVLSQARTTGKWKTEPCGTEHCFICEHFDESFTSSTPVSSIPTTSVKTSTTAQTVTNYSPTTTLNTNCDLSKQQWDIILLFDVSYLAMANEQMLLNLFKNISLALSTSFTIGPTGGQFVIGEYSNNTGIFSNFETFTSHDDLNFFIKNDVGQLGYENGIYNNLGDALQLINTQEVLAHGTGFRPNVRHMVIFSAVRPPPDAALAANVVKQLNDECVYSVGVGSHGTNLTNIVSSLDFTIDLSSEADVPRVISWLNQKICSALHNISRDDSGMLRAFLSLRSRSPTMSVALQLKVKAPDAPCVRVSDNCTGVKIMRSTSSSIFDQLYGIYNIV